jgi:tetratricopeptide (TPR) repeat protein
MAFAHGAYRHDNVLAMPKFILILTLFALLTISQSAFSEGYSLGFNPSELFDNNLDDQMVSLATSPDRGERALTRLISEIEIQDGQFAPRLYAYLNELALIKQGNQAHREAIDLFQRMQTLTHWADGVFSPLQMESIRLQSTSYVALGRLRDADRLEKFHFHVAEKSSKHGSDLIAPLWRLGDWQRASLQYRKALSNYERALKIIGDEQMDIAYKLRTLKAKALTEHLAHTCCADKTLLAIAGLIESDQFSDELAIREARLNAADMLLIRGEKGAIGHYQDLASAPAAFLGLSNQKQIFDALRRAENPFDYNASKEVLHIKQQASVTLGETPEPSPTFSTGDPVRLCATDLKFFKENPDSFVDVSIEISPEGKPANIELSGNAPNKLKRYLKTTLIKGAYRPEIENGEPHATTLTFRQHFNKTRSLKSSTVSEWRGILTEHACQLVAAR